MSRLLSDADRCLGRLDGVASMLPNPDRFVAMYVRQEAVLSSQIEGTQSTLEDLLEYEAGAPGDQPADVAEVVHYIAAMRHGLGELAERPISLELVKKIHGVLLRDGRGSQRSPGRFRDEIVWIGPAGCTPRTATFVPPPVEPMYEALDDLERFIVEGHALPTLIHCGLVHAQFETIHPFFDGNGRVGRLLITLMLCQRQVLRQPLLYLSYFFKAHRPAYYDRLNAVRREGDWEGWLKFFLRGVYEVSRMATGTARRVLNMRELHRAAIADLSIGGGLAGRLLEMLFEHPVVSVRMVEQRLGCAYVTAAKLIDAFAALDLLVEITGHQRNRRYQYQPYVELFNGPPEPDAST